MTPPGARPSSLLARIDGGIIAFARITAGLLWLANLEWKRPPDFGEDLGNGLYKYVDSAVRLPVFDPYAWFVEQVVIPNYRPFGWFTLLIESAVAALLLLGWKTRLAALTGALLTVPIFLSVLYYDQQYEWPWSYYLMATLMLLLFAVPAGRHFGLDGALAAGPGGRRRASMVLGAVAAGVGVAGLYVARDVGFAARQGAMLGWADGELKLLWFNPLGALLTVALGLLALVGGWRRVPVLVLGAAGGFAVAALLVVVQWRYRQGNWTGGILGATGPNLAFWGGLALGLALCAWPGRSDRRAAEPAERTTA